jgi:hypothetical protein
VRTYGENWLKNSVAQKLKEASVFGTFYGIMDYYAVRYIEECAAFHAPSGSVLIFTRDEGHHTSGWFKNPDYERCLHLSISFKEPYNVYQPRQFDQKLAKEWLDIFFGDDKRYVWSESPKSDEGRAIEVWHYRIFTDDLWRPIVARREVYSTELTEIGWKSYSELYPEDGRKEPSILHAG